MTNRLTHFIGVLGVLCVAAPVLAQNAPAAAWLDINFVSVHSRQGSQAYTLTIPDPFGENLTASTAYPALPSAKGGEVSGGVNLYHGVGFDVRFNAVNYEYPVGLSVRVPHPLFFNAFASDAGATEALERSERSVDLSAAYVVPTPEAWQVRIFGGPTYFSVRQAMVEDIEIDQVFDIFGGNQVTITGFVDEDVDEKAWGFNVGADVGYFFTRHVGVGGGVRFNQGTVTIDAEPLTGDPIELDAGGTSIGGGVRFRF